MFRINSLSTMKYGQNNKKCKNVRNELFIQNTWSYVYLFKSYSPRLEKLNSKGKKNVNKI